MTGRFASPTCSRWVVAFAVAAGLALRLAAARGGLWLDEAWSAVYAANARTPLGVFIAINHDNNHHLNSLWLQTIGLSAPPLLARLPSIIGGTAAIAVAAKIGARRNPATAMIAAISFAVSPILVDLGSQARGYATMTLALLGLLLVLDRWLDDPSARPPRLTIGALAAFGMVSQLTMVFGIVAMSGWVLVRLAMTGWRFKAIDRTVDVMLPALAAALIMFAMVFGAAAASSTGLEVGSYENFTAAGEIEALAGLTLETFGLSLPAAWATVIAVLLALAFGAARAHYHRFVFYLLAIVGLPVMIAVFQVPNTHYARYFLVSGIAALLLAAEGLGRAATTGSRASHLGALAIGIILLGASLYRDARMIANEHAHPAAPVAMIRAALPQRGSVLLDSERSQAVLQAAAASAHYPLTIRQHCPAAPFLLLDDTGHKVFPATVSRCSASYRRIRAVYKHDLPGMNWALYRRHAGRN